MSHFGTGVLSFNNSCKRLCRAGFVTLWPLLLAGFLLWGCDDSASAESEDVNELPGDLSADQLEDSTDDDIQTDTLDDTADRDVEPDIIGDADSDMGDVDQTEDTVLPDNCEPIPEADVRELDLDIPSADDLELDHGNGIFRSATDFETATGIEAPSGFDFQTEWIVVLNTNGFYEEDVSVEAFGVCDDQGGSYLIATLDRLRLDRDTCSLVGDLAFPEYQTFAVPAGSELRDRVSVQEDVTPLVCDESSPALGEPCTGGSLCQPGAICVGLSHSPTGVCSNDANQFRYDNSVMAPIPDNDPAGVSSVNTVPASVQGVIADLGIIYWEIDHPAPNELSYELTAPDGTTVEIGPTPDGELWRLIPGFDGVTAAGDWTLTVIDTSAGNIGEVDGWAIVGTTRPE